MLAAPLFQIAKHTPLPLSVSDSGSFINTYYIVIAVNVAFQIGFCTFVMSNYMKALPIELTEAAQVDGASIWSSTGRSSCRCAGRRWPRSATLEIIFIYNDFFWALLLIQKGDRLPITSGLNNLNGQFARTTTAGGRRTAVRRPRPDRLPGAAAAVRRRADPRRQQGMTGTGRVPARTRWPACRAQHLAAGMAAVTAALGGHIAFGGDYNPEQWPETSGRRTSN